jgi:hypothetical protein
MEAARRAGRIIGLLIVVQIVGSALVNFVLEAPLFGTAGFLASAASHSRQIGLAVFVSLIIEALWVGIAITAFPISYPRARTLTLWFVAVAVVVLAVAVLENACVMSMVSVSEAYANASTTEREQFQALRVIAASARNWAHYMGRIFDGVAAFLFYAVQYRLALVPRVIAGFGLIAVPLMIAGLMMPFFDHDVIFPLLAPLGFSQLILAAWLITKGFRDPEVAGIEPADVRHRDRK